MAVLNRPWPQDNARDASSERTRLGGLPWRDIAVGSGIFLAAFVVYLLTLTPSLSYNSLDGNELATIPYVLGLAHSTGYPLYTWLGKLFTYLPFGDVAHRVNIMSAFGAAFGAAMLYSVVRLTLAASQKREFPYTGALVTLAAALGALMLAFSTTLWSQAVIAEVYAPNVAMVGLTFLLLLSWARHENQRSNPEQIDGRSVALYALFALSLGLSTGMHLSNLALIPGFIIFTLLTNWRVLKQPQLIALAALGFFLGVLQFAWLPFKATEINDAFIARNTPSDLHGIYNYTLNAFPQMRWAFSISELPNRVVLYLNYVIDNFHVTGGLIALIGAWMMALRAPRMFFLFMPAYIIEVIFFLEYAVGDLDVFFITSHFLFAVFVAFGAYAIAELAARFLQRFREDVAWKRHASLAGVGVAAIFLAAQPVLSLTTHWSDNDQSANTGINDFYSIVFDELPQNSTLVGQGGVFGFDMFYFRLVYNERPDINMPGVKGVQRGPVTGNANTYTTSGNPFGGGGGGGFNNFGGQQQLGSFNVPVIASPTVREDTTGSTTRQLTLYKQSTQAPMLYQRNVTPQHAANATFGNLTLVGYDVDSSVEAGQAVRLKLYWRVSGVTGNNMIATKVGDVPYIEQHQLGFGNAQRLASQNTGGALLVEDYRLVVLSGLDAGDQTFRIRVGQGDWVDIGSITVTK